jgi:hypothetical protein
MAATGTHVRSYGDDVPVSSTAGYEAMMTGSAGSNNAYDHTVGDVIGIGSREPNSWDL